MVATVAQLKRRNLKRGQIYTAHNGSNLYRVIESVGVRVTANQPGERAVILYRTNRGRDLHFCLRSTFVDWIARHKARKTQKRRLRKL